MKEYRAPSYPKKKERRSKPDRRQNDTSNALQPLALAFMKYLETVSETQEQKIQSELKTAETLSKLLDNLGNIKIQVHGLTGQFLKHKPKKPKKSDNEHHKKVREIILSMWKNNKTYQQIADQLEKDGIPTFSGRGKWHAQTVHKLYQDYSSEVL